MGGFWGYCPQIGQIGQIVSQNETRSGVPKRDKYCLRTGHAVSQNETLALALALSLTWPRVNVNAASLRKSLTIKHLRRKGGASPRVRDATTCGPTTYESWVFFASWRDSCCAASSVPSRAQYGQSPRGSNESQHASMASASSEAVNSTSFPSSSKTDRISSSGSSAGSR